MIADVLKLVLALEGRPPAPSVPRRLDGLFRRLAAASPDQVADIEDMIWALWTHHENASAEDAMKRACGAIAHGRYGEAQALLDGLVAERPDWAEAWNKRATLHYLVERDAQSVADIRRTLEIEPRHFGALCGFAQICLRCGEDAAALAAFEVALRVHPALKGVPEAIAALSQRQPRRVH